VLLMMTVGYGMDVPATNVAHPFWCAGPPCCRRIGGVLTHRSSSILVNREANVVFTQPVGAKHSELWVFARGRRLVTTAGTARALEHSVTEVTRQSDSSDAGTVNRRPT
jgi:hypothetical protein